MRIADAQARLAAARAVKAEPAGDDQETQTPASEADGEAE